MSRNLRLALLLGLASALVAPTAVRAEAVLYRTADGQEGIVSDPSQVPPDATIVTERKRAVVRVPPDEIERALGAAPAARDAEDAPTPAARRDDLPPPPPGDVALDTPSELGDPTQDELEAELDDADDLEATASDDAFDAAQDEEDAALLEPVEPARVAAGSGSARRTRRSPEPLPVPSLSPEDRRAAELAHRERCEKLGLFGYSCTPEAISEAERWAALARGAREKRELGEARVAHLRSRYKTCSDARASAICPKRELEAAERRLAELERREEQIEDACRAAECLPGWLRL